MARVAHLKELLWHSNFIFSSAKFIDVYDNKEGFDGETAMCIQLADNKVGYIPLTESSIRGSHIKTIGADGKTYSLAVQRKRAYDDIAYCKATFEKYNENYITVSNNYVQLAISGASTSSNCAIILDFYDANDNKLVDYKQYVEDDVNLTILINAYLTFSGSGSNGYNFSYSGEELLGTISSYNNNDITINTKFNNAKRNEKIRFYISIRTPNTGNAVVNKITFKNLTINGRDIPIRLS